MQLPRLALFGVVIGLSGLAMAARFTDLVFPSSHLSTPEGASGSRQASKVALGSAVYPGLKPARSAATPEEIARVMADKVRKLEADTAIKEDRQAELHKAELKAAKTALVAALAKARLRRELVARQVTGTPASAATVQVAAAEVDADLADETDTLAAIAEDALPDTDGPTRAEVEQTVAELLPDLVPVPGKRPAVVPQSTQVASAPQRSNERAGATKLAYAASEVPDDDSTNVFSGLSKVFSSSGKVALPGRSSGIAVYDISAAVVHMPDGTKLEAHSGIGKMMDDPKYVKRRNMGPTPPNVYSLRMRESLFHGVEAIRMLPADPSAMHGRDGMLTHTNLLRGRTGSHGCVAFKDYAKFLKAFKAGKINKLIVVPELDDLPVYMASL